MHLSAYRMQSAQGAQATYDQVNLLTCRFSLQAQSHDFSTVCFTTQLHKIPFTLNKPIIKGNFKAKLKK